MKFTNYSITILPFNGKGWNPSTSKHTYCRTLEDGELVFLERRKSKRERETRENLVNKVEGSERVMRTLSL
jgi:hypothetical protein